ncbi:MAG TPA: SpoIIE family protein phosphatase [Bacteroidia bacterium]|nr:SpoIIE family protein phosphatase [Bacteroidia bacterium]
MNRIFLYFLFTSLFLPFISSASDIGIPFITSFNNKQYQAHNQNWAIVQDNKDLIYIGNNDGLLVCEGFDWTLINVDGNTITSLCKNNSGTVYAGLKGNFGYFKSSHGRYEFTSLSASLPENYKNFTTVWSTFSIDETEYFCSPEFIFIFRNNIFLQAVDAGEVGTFHKFFVLNKQLYIRQNGVGLEYLNKKNKLVLVPNGDYFSAIKIDLLLKQSNGYLIGTREQGLFVMDSFGIKSLACEASDFFRKNKLYCFTQIEPQKIACGTQLGGIAVINSDGKLLEIFDKSSGLNDNNVRSLFCDKQGFLWAALDNGISFVELNSAFRFYKTSTESSDNVNAVFATDKYVYAATTNGLFYSQRANDIITEFKLVVNSEAVFYDAIQSIRVGEDSLLIVLSKNGLFQLRGNSLEAIDKSSEKYELLQLKSYPSIVVVSEQDMIVLYVLKNGTLQKLKEVECLGIASGELHSLAEDNENTLWIGEKFGGVMSVSINKLIHEAEPIFTNYSFGTQFKLCEFNLIHENEKIYCCTNLGLYSYNKKNKKFEANNFLGSQFNKDRSYFKAFERNGEYWFSTYLKTGKNEYLPQILLARKTSKGKYAVKQAPFTRIYGTQVNHVFAHTDEEIWMASNDGLLKTKLTIVPGYQSYAIIREAKITSNFIDSVIFNGLAAADTLANRVYDYSYNTWEFSFYSTQLIAASETQFSTWLEGYEMEFSPFSRQSKKRNFTNLYEGTYVFHVKAKDIFGNVSKEATFKFTILPPWYRSWWAYFIYATFFGAVVYGVSHLNNRRLLKQKHILTTKVKEKTCELEKANVILEERNKEVTESIKYAQYIQKTMLPDKGTIKSFIPDSFVLFKPRNIVSGDFYWFFDLAKAFPDEIYFQFKAILVLADCTGHGVPGAFMSMIGIEKLNLSVKSKENISAANLLSFVNIELKKSLKQTGSDADSKDGMEMALCIIDKKNKTVEYAGANRPIMIFSNQDDSIREYKPTKAGLASSTSPHQVYENHLIYVQKGERIYLYSDGVVDQFGGEKNKKISTKGLRQLIIERKQIAMDDQAKSFESYLNSWMGNEEQTDDICLIGFEL